MFQNNYTVDCGTDRQNFIGQSSFQKSKDEIMGTLDLKVIYTLDNWYWWSPKTLFIKIMAGVFDSKVVFSGVTSEVQQEGNEISVKMIDEGWKLKQQYSGDDYSGDIKDILKGIIKEAGLKPILKGVVSEQIDRTTIWESNSNDSSSSSGGSCVESYGTCNCGHQEGVKAKKSWVNKCPHCNGTNLNFVVSGDNPEGRITCGNGVGKGGCDADYCSVCGYENISGSSFKITACSKKPTGNPSPRQEGTF